MKYGCKIVISWTDKNACVFFNPNKAWLKNYSLKKYRHRQKCISKMSYSESEPNPNSLSIFASIFSKSESESDSESDFNSGFMNLRICVFFTLYLHSSK